MTRDPMSRLDLTDVPRVELSAVPGEIWPRIAALAARFQGVDLKYRRVWGRWVAINHCSKNERNDYRITCWGSTAAEALTALLDAVDAVDRGDPKP